MTTVAGYPATIKTLSNGELRQLKVHKIAQAFDPLEGDERDALRASIRARYDESQPIVCWAETGELIDGRNRRDAAAVLHCRDVPVAFVDFPDEAAIIEYVRAQNLTRRHLTPEKRAEAAAKLVNGGMSTRSAAKATGVSQSTARRAAVVKRSGESDDSPATRTTGTDGKSYPATKPSSPTRAPKALTAKQAAKEAVEHRARVGRALSGMRINADYISAALDAHHTDGTDAATLVEWAHEVEAVRVVLARLARVAKKRDISEATAA